jgi:hypothetical protein
MSNEQTAPQTTENQPQGEQQQQTNSQTEQPKQEATDAWNDAEFNKVATRYKNDIKEVAKAKWHQDKEMTRLQQKVAAFEKSAAKENPTSSTPKEQAKTPANDAKPATANQLNLSKTMYAEIFDSGKPSNDTLQAYKDAGYTDAEISLEVQAKKQIIQQRTKEAQQFVDTDITELRKFAMESGKFTNKELAVIQGALDLAAETGNANWYRILKVLDAQYKSGEKEVVQHGEAAKFVPQDGYASAKDYAKDKKDPRYMFDKDYINMVNEKFKRSNTDKWAEQLFGFVR